jgi:hypothetical protein
VSIARSFSLGARGARAKGAPHFSISDRDTRKSSPCGAKAPFAEGEAGEAQNRRF